MSKSTLALALAGLLLGVTPSAAQNLLVNPTFTSDTSGWLAGNFDPTQDASGNPPGSAMLLNTAAGGATTTLMFQCFNGATPGATYAFGGSVRLSRAAGEVTTGDGRIALGWNSAPNCLFANSLGVDEAGAIVQLDSWLPLSSTAVAPAGTVSVAVFLSVRKNEAGGSFQGNFDDPFLQLQAAVPALGAGPLALLAVALGMTAWLRLRNPV